MTKKRVILLFDNSVSHRKMAGLMKFGDLLVPRSPRNVASVDFLRPRGGEAERSLPTIADVSPNGLQSRMTLEFWLEDTIARLLDGVTQVDVVGFTDEAQCDEALRAWGFAREPSSIEAAFSYAAAP